MRLATRWQPQRTEEDARSTVSNQPPQQPNSMSLPLTSQRNKWQRPAPLSIPPDSASSALLPPTPPTKPPDVVVSSNNTSTPLVWVKLLPKRPNLSRSTSRKFSGVTLPDEDFSETGRTPWAWRLGLLLEQTKSDLVVQLLDEDGQTHVFPADALGDTVLSRPDFKLDEDGRILAPDDLITLTSLNEPAVMESLEARYYSDQIYTHTGAVLLALNPFCAVRGLYGETAMRQYWQQAESGLAAKSTIPPHVYGIADAAFRSMQRQLEDGGRSAHQSILVSGESGAGKTVTTKFVMKYLAALSQRSTLQPKERAYAKVAAARTFQGNAHSPTGEQDNLASLTLLQSANSTIEGQVLQSNPILESFGNARTVRNDNSSRFGKFIEIQFSATGKLVGASIETYLLEKVRLVHQSYGERNYHIFYELLSGGMDARQLSHYFIAPTAHPEDFKLTASGTYDRRDNVSDQETYRSLRQACAAMKFTNAELHDVFCVTAALLHASNLTLLEDDNGDSCWLDTDNIHLIPVCHLLGVTAQDLELALCQQTLIVGRDQTVTKKLGLEKAIKGLEALLKAIYGALFQYLVYRINDSVARREGDDAPVASVRVLDIFGFESFGINSFEQLCINYCNETLQQQFNAFVLRNEQSEYEREGIDWSFISFEENQDILDLIDKRGTGILSILDDQCRAPGPSDKAFLLQVYKQCTGHERFSVSSRQEANQQFCIHHYAGNVVYTCYGFVEKNRDELSREGTELVKNSHSLFLQELALIMQEVIQEPLPSATPLSPLRRSDSSVGRPTVGGQFRRQLKHLRCKIDETTPHYIRCLKPNDILVPGQLDKAVVAEQLRCGGILEAVRVARAGFTQHYAHADFVRRYRTLVWREMVTIAPSPRGTTSYNRRGPSTPKAALEIEVDAKAQCKDLIKLLYRKLQEQDALDKNQEVQQKQQLHMPKSSSPAKARSYSYTSTGVRPSWSKASSPHSATFKSPALKQQEHVRNSASDFANVGIQLGKTKVFLRHQAFEALERIRSRMQSRAATLLNSMFRMYLARLAYIPYRDAYRREMRNRYEGGFHEDEHKEAKEDKRLEKSVRFQSFTERTKLQLSSYAKESLVDKWVESQVRNAIHNPLPRHKWGKAAPSNAEARFKWVLSEGLWIKSVLE